MFCPKCGTAVDDTQAFCGNCGASLTAAKAAQTKRAAQVAKEAQFAEAAQTTNAGQAAHTTQSPSVTQVAQKPASNTPFGLAIAGLVCAVIGLFPVGAVLSIVALVKNSNQIKAGIVTTKQGPTKVMGVIGVVISAIWLIVSLLFGAALISAVQNGEFSSTTTPSSTSSITDSGNKANTSSTSSGNASASSLFVLDPECAHAYEYIQRFKASDTYAEIEETIDSIFDLLDEADEFQDLDFARLKNLERRLDDLSEDIPGYGKCPDAAYDYFFSDYEMWVSSVSFASFDLSAAKSKYDKNDMDSAYGYVNSALERLRKSEEIRARMDKKEQELFEKAYV